MALVSTLTGLRSLDLANALERVTVPGRFLYTPVVRGGPGFLAAHTSFSVHWPPRNLPKRVAGEVLRAMKLYRDLADKLKNRGLPDLENNMRAAREGKWLSPQKSEYNFTEIDEEEIEFEPFEGDQLIEELDSNYDFEFSNNIKIPDDLREEFKKAWVCISQNGSIRGHLWGEKHLNTHVNFNRCKSTQSGNHHVYTRNHHGGWCYY